VQQTSASDRESIRLFVTGGTFDKEYNELTGQLYFHDSHVQEMLRLGRCLAPVDVRTLMMVDSLEMTPADRQVIADNCAAVQERRIVITHGTDTMAETAAHLGQQCEAGVLAGKTIVLTGAMVPYKFGSSDGLFNLGVALALVQTLAPGVYVAMNGRWFDWRNVRKNRERGIFEAL
jgi:L-asparaginase